MMFRSIVLLCALALPMTNAVINTNSEAKVERREAPFETYGPPELQPKHQTVILPTPVYGAPAVHNYPPPPPERPPPLPAKEYGVPVLQYGPPKVQIEYGPPPPAHSHQQIQTNNHHHHQVINHGSQNSLSFFDQIKQSLGFGDNNGPSNYVPHSSYGPPPPAPVNHFTLPKMQVHTKYGAPPKPHFVSKPPTVYGPPPSKPHTNYGPPKPQYQAPAPLKSFYGPPLKQAVNFKPLQQNYGPPQQNYGPPPPPPQHSYGPPQQSYGSPPPQQTYGLPSTPIRQPLSSYGPPSLPSFPKPIHGAGCDGWKPIPGPSIGTQAIANSHTATIQAVEPENTYLPPSSANLHVADATLQVHPLPTNLQLPVAEAPSFHNDADLGASLASGLGLTSINVVKSEGIELSNNFIDSYSAPPADTYAPDFYRKPPSGLTPPSYPYSIGSFKQYPYHINAPKHPISFRPPVPQGLFESIGQSVKHQEQFGVKLHQHSNVYLPPPTNEIPPPPPGLESLPLAPAAPFHSQQAKANLFDKFVYSPQPCSHGPNLAGGPSFTGGPSYASGPSFAGGPSYAGGPSFAIQNSAGSLPQLQTVYGVPNQALDVSQSSSFEIAQNADPQQLLTSYGPPASGAASSIDSLINTHEINAASSSYGPPPSGNPADSYAHSSQKSLSTVQIDSSSNSTTNATDSQIAELPGLSTSGLDIISAQKSIPLELPVQGQHGTYSLQFQAADPLASQNNEIDTPDHQKLLSEGLLQSILSAIEEPKGSEVPQFRRENLNDHPDINEFVQSVVGQETLAEVKAE